ncbi:MAG: hypothetical protein ACLPN1_05940 [Dissulfurispiraceae bacterium]
MRKKDKPEKNSLEGKGLSITRKRRCYPTEEEVKAIAGNLGKYPWMYFLILSLRPSELRWLKERKQKPSSFHSNE